MSIIQRRVSFISNMPVTVSNGVENRRLKRKIDWRIIPLAAWACGLQFVDKVRIERFLHVLEANARQSGLGAAATYGLREDIHLVGQEYSWCVSVWSLRLPPLRSF